MYISPEKKKKQLSSHLYISGITSLTNTHGFVWGHFFICSLQVAMWASEIIQTWKKLKYFYSPSINAFLEYKMPVYFLISRFRLSLFLLFSKNSVQGSVWFSLKPFNTGLLLLSICCLDLSLYPAWWSLVTFNQYVSLSFLGVQVYLYLLATLGVGGLTWLIWQISYERKWWELPFVARARCSETLSLCHSNSNIWDDRCSENISPGMRRQGAELPADLQCTWNMREK